MGHLSKPQLLYWGIVYYQPKEDGPMAEAKRLTTKRLVIGHVLVCKGCCCGAVERGRPEVPDEWLKTEWRRRGLLKRLQLTISGCLGPCDVPNVGDRFRHDDAPVWNVSGQQMYQEIVDWA